MFKNLGLVIRGKHEQFVNFKFNVEVGSNHKKLFLRNYNFVIVFWF